MSIEVKDGASARGVGVGAGIVRIKRAFPRAKLEPYGGSGPRIVRIPRGGGGRMEFGLDLDTKKTVEIGVPYLVSRFCGAPRSA